MARYGTDTQAHRMSSITNQLPIGPSDKRFYSDIAPGMTVKGYNSCADPIIRTDVTSDDMIWNKSVAKSWGNPSQSWGHAVPAHVSGSGAPRFPGEDLQYISDTESEHSCSSADTMILLNGEHMQNVSQALDTYGQCHSHGTINETGLSHGSHIGLSHSQYGATSRVSPTYQQHNQKALHSHSNRQSLSQTQQKLQGANRLTREKGTLAPPGVDNHSDDGYESNDTNMSFETGSSGSLCSKDSGQAGSMDPSKPKSILKKAGQSNKINERSVRFAGDGENDKHLETKTSPVQRQYTPSKTGDLIPSVVAVKRTVGKSEKDDDSNTPSLEERLRQLVVNDDRDIEIPAGQGKGANKSRGDSGSNTRQSWQSDQITNTSDWGTVEQKRARSIPFVKSPSLSTIQEQSHSLPEPRVRYPHTTDRQKETRLDKYPREYEDYYNKRHGDNNRRLPHDGVDNDTYISSSQVKLLMNKQSDLQRSHGAGETRPGAPAERRVTHHSSLTNLPSQNQNHDPSLGLHSMSHHASLMQLTPNTRNYNDNMFPRSTKHLVDCTQSSRTLQDLPHSQPMAGSKHYGEMSPCPRQRHSYATYNDLTEMYKAMASGQMAPNRNRRFSNSSEISLNSVTSTRSVDPNSRPKVVYGTTADLYRLMKDQIRQPSTHMVGTSDNSIT